jgi:hypothetical protein
MAFRTAEPSLKDVLDSIAKGETQLPDFQRGWVWDDAHIRSLLASLSVSYPIGAVMFLEAGGVPFKPRLFAGVPNHTETVPKMLVLDGQQRLTSMYLALRSGQPVNTKTEKGDEIWRVYFFDMAKCLDPKVDREEAISSVPETLKITSDFGRKIDLDLSTPELQYQHRMFPASLMFDAEGFMRWRMGYSTASPDVDSMKFLMNFEQEVWLPFQKYKVPAIEMSSDTPREAVCQVFEKVNTGGVTLTVFELMTAMFAADEFNLREYWDACSKRMTEKREVLEAVDGTAFLTAVTLLASFERSKFNQKPVSCKRTDVLRLSLEDFQQHSKRVEEGFRKAAEILAEEKIFDSRSLPYPTQLIPMAAICSALSGKIDEQPVKEKVLRWYWCGIFGELYGGANETRYGLDLPNVAQWVNGGEEPRTVRDSGFAPTRLLSLQSRLAAAYKGVAALLMKYGSRDFIGGTPIDINTYFDKAIDIHHIFPRAWCEKEKLPREKWNSAVNKAPLAAATNRYIGGNKPSKYLGRIQNDKKIEPETLDAFLASHVIPVSNLRADDFDGFIQARANSLLKLIEQATGKGVAGRDSLETIVAFGAALT